MNNKSLSLASLQGQFENLRQQLVKSGYISQGSVQDRTRRKGGGAGYQWTRKVGRKTITVSLTHAQFQQMKEAISNRRHLARCLGRMEKLSRRIIFESNPHPDRRKRLSNRVLGFN